MDPEEKQLLQNTLSLVEENNKLLHKVRGVQKRDVLWRVLKILIIVGIALGFFIFLEPYFDKVVGLYDSVIGIQQKVESSPLQDFLDKF